MAATRGNEVWNPFDRRKAATTGAAANEDEGGLFWPRQRSDGVVLTHAT